MQGGVYADFNWFSLNYIVDVAVELRGRRVTALRRIQDVVMFVNGLES